LNVAYGFHLIKFDNFIGHTGSIQGYDSVILYEIATKTTIVIVVNVFAYKQNIPVAYRISEYIIARLNNKTTFADMYKIFIPPKLGIAKNNIF